ncbi:MAG: phosphoglucosamine mutase [Bacteroidales bacterium]|jgi:phosphomannomutase|nr:phosphoglucosamine mutase [Bacteroidales bacterium]NLP19527.1 phosphoglucosamine mutase [Bacteroidales bacterium]OQC46328.1 MAG: Phosphomannomutase/phosphoglucomutase [Bacteroidetes bacterium ADurb.Bin028]
MTLIKSISGIRGTIGGFAGENLTPIDIVKFITAYSLWQKETNPKAKTIVVGRDARPSGKMVENIVVSVFNSLGFDVINIGLATTPTTEFAVINEKADGGIIITASHNPKNWNALKLLNNKGEFLSASEGQRILELAETANAEFAQVDDLGKTTKLRNYENLHIDSILKLKLVNKELIKATDFTVAIDCVNSVGGFAIPKLLKSLGVKNIIELYCTPNGQFPHNPEPLPEHLTEISNLIKEKNADVGFVVDPDVDRLAIICEDGSMFGEEYTLVAVADYVLSKTPGNTVSNLSSTRALRDVSEKYGVEYNSAAVGEVNVVAKMKETNAVIGGEGNGGVIYPESHYGRDALVGIALFLSFLAEKQLKVSELKKTYPNYFISKNKIELTKDINLNNIFEKLLEKYKNNPHHTIDGLKIEFPETKEWVHLRSSNTEPIIRIYCESLNQKNAEALAKKFIEEIKNLM